MDDTTLIAMLEAALQHPDVSRRNRLFIADCLPDLRNETLTDKDRAELFAIARDFAVHHPTAAHATLGDANTITDANAAIGNMTGRDFTQNTQSGGIDNRDATFERVRDIIGGNQSITNNYGAQTDLRPLIEAYLDDLQIECCRLPLADVDVDNFDPQQNQIVLDAVYTMLEVASTVEVPADDQRRRLVGREQHRQRTALEAVSAHGRLVLLGEPGGGKSTFVNFLTLVLAHAQRTPAALDQLAGWTHGAVIPIRLILREFAVWVEHHGAGIGAADLVWRYLESRYPPALVTWLRQASRDHKALLLLDGYDEVPRTAHGEPLARVRAALVALRSVPLVLVTCRVLDYTESSDRQLMNWPDERIMPFSPQLQDQFIKQWYATLRTLKRPTNGDPNHLRAEVRGRPELQRLAGNPLLLTMMAQLHAFKTRLPDERVKLYAECIEFLLYRWRPKQHDRSLAEILELPTWSQQHTLGLLNRLGYVAHRLGSSRDGETGSDLPLDVLLTTAKAYFWAFDPYQAHKRATAFADYVARHSNGVLQQFGPELFRFPHRTFQEFLAARRLVSDDDWPSNEDDVVERCIAVLPDPQWREVLALAISQLVQTDQSRTAVDILEAIAERGEPAAFATVVAAELWTEVGRERTKRLGTKRTRLLHTTLESLVTIIENPDVTLDGQYRIRAGTALGTLGDPRRGVCDLHLDWCNVAAGAYTLGSDDNDADADADEKPLQMVTLPAFRISRYPVTNAQWRLFMDAGGYTDVQWWRDGWAEREGNEWTEPNDWNDQRFNAPNQPVVGVSWYESMAFCAWLSHTLDYLILLPTEAQWEAAARGPVRPMYPWGDAWDAERANTGESNLNRTTVVGSYPHGASWCGALDLSGNVWEWTRSDFTHADRTNEIDIMSNSTSVSNRGGAWYDGRQVARCAYLGGGGPHGRTNNLGLRVVTPLTK